jgi:hypothetical protein
VIYYDSDGSSDDVRVLSTNNPPPQPPPPTTVPHFQCQPFDSPDDSKPPYDVTPTITHNPFDATPTFDPAHRVEFAPRARAESIPDLPMMDDDVEIDMPETNGSRDSLTPRVGLSGTIV